MTMMLRAGVAIVCLLSATSFASAADRTVTLRLGANSTLIVARPFKTVLIDNPLVVEVHEQGDRAVVLEPLDLGATNLVFVDAKSIAITNVRVVVCSRATRVSVADKDDCEQE